MFNLNLELRNKRILIVDDLVEPRSSLKKMMSILGAAEANIDTAATGQEASKLLAEHNYQLVLADYNLQRGKDGQQVLEEARFTNRLKATSVFIMITAENAMDMVMGALEYEPDSYITKPYTLNMLKERLQRILVLKQRLVDINRAIDQQDTDSAIRLSEEMLHKKPKFLVALTRILGKLHLRQEDYQQALQTYDHLLDKRNASWAYLGKAICLFRLGDPQAALDLLQSTLAKHPLYVQCYDWSATILMSLNEPVKAQAMLERAVDISPKSVLRQKQLGDTAFNNADYPTAIQALERAIKLGRLSCYKNPDSYLLYARCAYSILNSDQPSEDNKRLTNKALAYSKEVKKEYSEQLEVQFDACINEGYLYLVTQQNQQASAFAQQAEEFLDKINQPSIERQLQVIELLIKTQQDVKAKERLLGTKKKAAAQPEYQHRIAALEADLNSSSIDDHISQLNSQGIELYSKKDYPNAIIFFDKATAHSEASVSVLMNAIQTKISAMESEGVNINYLKDCHSYFKRAGDLDPSDKRYQRYQQLQHTFGHMWQKAGLN